YRPDQGQVIPAEAIRPVGREGDADPLTARRVATRKGGELGEIIGSAGNGEPPQDRKIEPRFGAGEAPAQPGRGARLGATFGLADQGGERAVRNVLLVGLAAFDLSGLDDVEIALPSIAVARPLRMQSAHPGKGAPQWHAGTNEPAAQPVEQP